MRVTIAICTYNRAELLRETLAGIARQDFPPEEFEVLVIDNNSGDHTAQVVAEAAGYRPAPRHILETRQGLDHARNRALAEARGAIVIFADDDILVEPQWIAAMAAPLEADPGRTIGAVGGEVVPVFPDGLPAWVTEWHSPLAFRSDAGPLPPEHSPMGANLALPKWVFERLGTFHLGLDRSGANLFAGGDAEMIRRVHAAGLAVWFAPAGRVRHQITAARTNFRYIARHAFDSARSRVVDRAGRPGATLYLLSRLPANAAKAAAFALLALGNGVVGRSGAAKKALVRAWRSCGYLYQIPRSCCGKL